MFKPSQYRWVDGGAILIKSMRGNALKKVLYILALTLGFSSIADDLTVKDGAVYRNVTIISVNPDQMLIVHDGGGCQVKFKDLIPHSLTAEQRQKVEEELQYYTKRQARIEKAAAERKAFADTQRAKGLIEFEGTWMTPLEKEELLMNREERKLDLERQRLQLAKEQAALEKERLETARARYLLEGDKSRRSSTITVGYFSSFHRTRGYWHPYDRSRLCGDKHGYHPAIYTHCNSVTPQKPKNSRLFINPGKPLSYSTSAFNR